MRTVAITLVLACLFLGCPGPEVCSTTGTGTVSFTTGPLGLSSSLRLVVTGPAGSSTVDGLTSLTGIAAGSYTLTAQKLVVADPLVRTASTVTVSPATFCLRDGQTQVVTVAWDPIPTSHALWVTNGSAATARRWASRRTCCAPAVHRPRPSPRRPSRGRT
jgi:hypothetical protein